MRVTRISALEAMADLPDDAVYVAHAPPPNRWRLWVEPGLCIDRPSAPNRFHRWWLGWLCGFRWERLP